MAKLSVNVNKVALLRNTRHLGIPSVTRAAVICLDAGAHGITVHPRPDGRHIRTEDVHELAALLKQHRQAEYNIEGNPFENALDLVREVKPHQFTLVPDDPGQFTSDHGWDIPRHEARLKPLIAEVKRLGVRVSLFMDADPALMAGAAAAQAAHAAGLGVNAGHDLNRDNLPDFLQSVPGVLEVSIGHALIADALEMGYAATIRAYLAAMSRGSRMHEQ